jgi:hypothetical protein
MGECKMWHDQKCPIDISVAMVEALAGALYRENGWHVPFEDLMPYVDRRKTYIIKARRIIGDWLPDEDGVSPWLVVILPEEEEHHD